MASYKPKNYNSLSPYLIVDDAEKLVDLLKIIFDAKELRRYNREDGSIMHLELQLDDSVVMISDSTEDYPAITAMLHIYVPDVFKTFDLAIEHDCLLLERPITKPDDTDTRGSFLDPAGNYWAVSTQQDI
ncbi:VOC family protein [Gelidibacter sp.]|uniref:VOC family protein n=1 Tax=Gelidibacter sp. TaxID=2018083 RepID=UPI002C05E3D2|nr:VOC family protein [Gelidibacter sp.]HUH27827.1 VOC family protein [Gelidibacter sp.]